MPLFYFDIMDLETSFIDLFPHQDRQSFLFTRCMVRICSSFQPLSLKVGHFVPVYEGRAKQCNASRLQPSTIYKFRLAAVNELGSSLYSEIVSYATQVKYEGEVW